MNKTRVILAGATGWAGSAFAKAIATTNDLYHASSVWRKNAGQNLGTVLGDERLKCTIFASTQEANMTKISTPFVWLSSTQCSKTT